MDTYSQDSAHTTGRPATFQTPEDKATHRRWARAVLAFHCSLFVLGGIAILANYSGTNSSNLVVQNTHARP
jgi:hypothetical protein